MARRQFAAHMPEFLQIGLGVALGRLDAEGGQPALAATAGHDVTALHIFRQRKERLGGGIGAVDQSLIDAVIGHHGKTGAGKRIAKTSSSGGQIGVHQRKRNRLDVGSKCHVRPLPRILAVCQSP